MTICLMLIDIPKLNEPATDLILAALKISSLEERKKKSPTYTLLKALPTLAKKERVDEVLAYYIERDCSEIQFFVGKALSKMVEASSYVTMLLEALTSKEKELKLGVIDQKTYQASFSLKRTCVIYLYEALKTHEPTLQSKFIDMQRVFLRYIFDSKALVQECSSNAVTVIYKAGDEQVRSQLVQALSSTLGGAGEAGAEVKAV